MFFFNINLPIYLGVTYISPESSPMNNIYDRDLFLQLEDDISYFTQFGRVFITGDMNSRVGQKRDYIEFDRLLHIDDAIQVDLPMPRQSCDHSSNRFGDSLLDLCKIMTQDIIHV